jgi:hypothetical protein
MCSTVIKAFHIAGYFEKIDSEYYHISIFDTSKGDLKIKVPVFDEDTIKELKSIEKGKYIYNSDKEYQFLIDTIAKYEDK